MEANEITWSQWHFLNACSGHHERGSTQEQEYELSDEERAKLKAKQRRPFGFCVKGNTQ